MSISPLLVLLLALPPIRTPVQAPTPTLAQQPVPVSAQQAAPTPAQEAALASAPVLRKVFVIGASLSHGFGLDQELGARIGFADVIEASLRVPHGRIQSRTSLLFFTAPLPTGQAQAIAAAGAAPSLVVAIDSLFWFGYGVFATEDDRLAMLDRGLALLDGFDCPVLVGDIPDVEDAAGSPARGDRPARAGLLVQEQIPDATLRAKLNARIRSWAEKRPNVIVIPLAELVARLHADEDLVIHGNRWSKDSLAGLVQKDRLHPSLEGAIALWLGALESLVAGRRDIPVSAFDWDAGSIRKRLRDAVEKERAGRESQGRARSESETSTPRAPAGVGGGR